MDQPARLRGELRIDPDHPRTVQLVERGSVAFSGTVETRESGASGVEKAEVVHDLELRFDQYRVTGPDDY